MQKINWPAIARKVETGLIAFLLLWSQTEYGRVWLHSHPLLESIAGTLYLVYRAGGDGILKKVSP